MKLRLENWCSHDWSTHVSKDGTSA